MTHSLLDDSPALDNGNYYGCENNTGKLLVDQRGYSRHVTTVYSPSYGNFCDIGAYERQQFRQIELPGLELDITSPWTHSNDD